MLTAKNNTAQASYWEAKWDMPTGARTPVHNIIPLHADMCPHGGFGRSYLIVLSRLRPRLFHRSRHEFHAWPDDLKSVIHARYVCECYLVRIFMFSSFYWLDSCNKTHIALTNPWWNICKKRIENRISLD